MDKYLLEAMREVDAMLPGTPPIAPPEEPYDKANRIFGHRMDNSGAALMAHRDYLVGLSETTLTYQDGTALEELLARPRR